MAESAAAVVVVLRWEWESGRRVRNLLREAVARGVAIVIVLEIDGFGWVGAER